MLFVLLNSSAEICAGSLAGCWILGIFATSSQVYGVIWHAWFGASTLYLFGSCQTFLEAAKLGIPPRPGISFPGAEFHPPGPGLAAAKLKQVPNQSLGNEKLSSLMLLC